MQDLVAALDACSARQLHLNPVTAAAGAKCLSGVAAAECRELSPAEARQLAAESAGDLRNAIGMLQMLLCGTAPAPQAKGRKVRRMRLPEADLAHKTPRPFDEKKSLTDQTAHAATCAAAIHMLPAAHSSWDTILFLRRAPRQSASATAWAGSRSRRRAARPSPGATRASRCSMPSASCYATSGSIRRIQRSRPRSRPPQPARGR